MNISTLNSGKSMSAMHAFYPIIVISGFIQLLLPSTIRILMSHFSIKAGEAGILPLIFFSGIMTSAFAITHIIKKFSIKTIMIFATLIVSASLIAASQSHEFLLFAALVFFTGFGNGIMVTLPGIYATNQHAERSAKLQSTIFSFLAFGFVLGPVFPGIISYLELSWRWSFALPGLLLIPALIPILLAKHEPVDKAEKLTLSILKEIIAFDKKFFFEIVTTLIIAAGAAVALLTWLITFLETQQSTPLGTAHIVLSAMGIAAVSGRLIWGTVSTKLTAFRTLLIIVPISAILVFLAPLSQTVAINIILFFMAMFFVSGINPLLLSSAAIYPKSHSSSVYTILFISMGMGGATIPFCIGQVFQHAGAEVGIGSIAILFAITTALLFLIKKEIPILKHMHKNPLL